MFSMGVLTPVGPQKWVRCSGVVMHSKTSARGASQSAYIGQLSEAVDSLRSWLLLLGCEGVCC